MSACRLRYELLRADPASASRSSAITPRATTPAAGRSITDLFALATA